MAFQNPIRKLSQLVADKLVGATIQTAASGARWVMSSNPANTLQGFTGDASETSPGELTIRTVAGIAPGEIDLETVLAAPQSTSNPYIPSLTMYSTPDGKPGGAALGIGGSDSQIQLHPGVIEILTTALGTILLGRNSTAFSGCSFGTFNGNTDASGGVTIPHGLGHTPQVVFWMDGAGNHPYLGRNQASANDGTNIRMLFRRTDTDAAAASGVSINGAWLAIY